jgi:uncharacterized protein (DUF1501 family)
MRAPLDRRRLLKLAGGAAGSVYAIGLGAGLAASEEEAGPDADHFLLQVIFPGGLDPTYLFDARSPALKQAGKHAFYLDEAPTVWRGDNGVDTLATSLVAPLAPFRDRFSVINGVVMVPAFDGHEQNIGWLITGNAFSGESQLPHVNVGAAPAPLDYIQVGDGTLLTTITNTGNAVPLNASSAASFAERLKALTGVGQETALNRFVRNRMQVSARLPGTFGAGADAMAQGFTKMPQLMRTLASVEIDTSTGDPILQQIQLIGEMFKGRVCRGGLFVFDTDLNPKQNLDTHDYESAAALPDVLPKLMGELASIFRYLAETEYRDGRSLLDVTTVMVGSEFGRTLYQPWVQNGKMGTDHNPLTNTVLLGGRGIRGGCVIGGSDLYAVDEEVSSAHLSQDGQKLKAMGRPFDFARGVVREDKPEAYVSGDYLNYASVANTIYEVFGVGRERYRVVERNAGVAPVLGQLLELR